MSVLVTATARVITAISRATVACANHGEIVSVQPAEGRIVEKGCYLAVMIYAVTFEDGSARKYWMRGGVPTEVKK